MYPWQTLFLVNAIPFFLLAMLGFSVLPTNPNNCSGFLQEEEQKFLVLKTEASQDGKRKKSNKLAGAKRDSEVIWQLIRDRRVILLALSRCVRTIAVFGLTFFTPLILSGGGKRDMSTVALLNTIPTVVSISFNQFW